MKSVYPGLTPGELDTLISQGTITEDLSGDGPTVRNDSFGYGLIDAYKAVLAVADSALIPTFMIVNPLSLNFGSLSEEKTLKVTKSNTSNPLTVESVTDNADWLTVTPDPGDYSDGIGTYTVTVDRAFLPDGPYYGTITFESSKNSVDISVTMYQGDVTVGGDSGYHYILLIDADTYQSLYQEEVSATNGSYVYRFASVVEGDYIVFAGTDSDNDFYIGDSGESTGAYISLDQPVTIRVDENLSGIDFNTSFNLNLPMDLSTDNGKSEAPVRRMGTR
jgi:serine protease